MNFQNEDMYEIEFISGEEYSFDKPKKIHNRTRDKAFNVRFTSEEFKMITEKQLESKLTRSDFFLALTSEKPIYVIDHVDEILKELNTQGKNINQIARALNLYNVNFEKYHSPEKNYQEALKRLTAELEQVRDGHRNIYQAVLKILQEVRN